MRTVQKVLAMAFVISVSIGMGRGALAQPTMDDVKITATQLSEHVYMLTGAGGNIGVYVGSDGAVMVDAQYAALSDKILAALSDITQQPLQLLVNTHYHRDHTDGNANFAKQGAVVVAHQRVAERLLENENFDQLGLPKLTFSDGMSLRVGQEMLKLQHFPTAHTDGDAVVWFGDDNVIHAGDLFFVDRFPFIDLNSGGNVQGFIDAVSATIAMLDDDTKIIPGHGPLADKKDWQRLVSMVITTREEVRLMKQQGMSVEEVVTAGLDEKWADWSWGFINEERWIRTLYTDL